MTIYTEHLTAIVDGDTSGLRKSFDEAKAESDELRRKLDTPYQAKLIFTEDGRPEPHDGTDDDQEVKISVVAEGAVAEAAKVRTEAEDYLKAHPIKLLVQPPPPVLVPVEEVPGGRRRDERGRFLPGGGNGGAGGIGGGGRGNGGGYDGHGRLPPTGGGGNWFSQWFSKYEEKQKEGEGILRKLLFGDEGHFAAFGTLGSLAGLGKEHFLLSGIGVMASAATAAVGGLLLALGAVGKMAVGGGVDMLVNRETMKNIGLLVTGYSTLKKDIAEYGKNSTEAIQQQRLLNSELKSFGSAGPAIAKTAMQLIHLKASFAKETEPAEKFSAMIFGGMLSVAQHFIPAIAKAAKENLAITFKALQPLFHWLKGSQAMGIFNTLENSFRKGLPASIHTATEFVKLFLRTLAYLQRYSGHLTETLGKMFSNADGAGWDAYTKKINNLIGTFRMWEKMLEMLGKDIALILGSDQGTGKSIVLTLTKLLTQLHKYLELPSSKGALTKLFTAHKNELIDMLKLLPSLLSGFGKIELAVGPQLTKLLGAFLKVLTAFINHTGSVGKMALAFGILASRAHLFGNAMNGIRFGAHLIKDMRNFGALMNGANDVSGLTGLGKMAPMIGTLGRKLGLLKALGEEAGEGEVAAAAGEDAITASAAPMDAALDANPIGAIVLAVTGLSIGLYELVKHFKTVSAFLNGPWGTALSVAVSVFMPLVGIAMLVIGHWKMLLRIFMDVVDFFKRDWENILKVAIAIMLPFISIPFEIIKHWKQLPGWFADLWRDMKKVFKESLDLLVDWLVKWPVDVMKAIYSLDRFMVLFAIKVMRDFLNEIKRGAKTLIGFYASIPMAVIRVLRSLDGDLSRLGSKIMQGLRTAIAAGYRATEKFFEAIPHNIVRAFGAASRILVIVGGAIIHGLFSGAGAVLRAGWSVFGGIRSLIGNVFRGSVNWLVGAGEQIVAGLVRGIRNAAGGLTRVADGVAKSALHALEHPFHFGSPSKVMIQDGMNIMAGLEKGILDNRNRPIKALGDTANKMTMTRFGSPSIGGRRGGGTGAINIDISVDARGLTNPQQIMQAHRTAAQELVPKITKAINAGVGT